jgi:hypothetical protein
VGESLKIKTHPVWMWIGFEKKQEEASGCPFGHLDFLVLELGLERRKRKQSGGLFSRRGRVHKEGAAIRRIVDTSLSFGKREVVERG